MQKELSHFSEQSTLPRHCLQTNSTAARIAVPTFDGLQMLNVSEIVRCTAQESYTEIHIAGGAKLTVSRNLKEYEDLLVDFGFFRVHHSCLVNLVHVMKYLKVGTLVMSDGTCCEVARRKRTSLQVRLSLVCL